MGFHTFDVDRADSLDDPTRYRSLSVEELLALLDPDADDAVADLGSGTGFYTSDVAPYVRELYAIDVQPEMHELYREKGLPDAVVPVTAEISSLPFADDALDGAFSTMTYHEFASEAALDELRRVVGPGGRLAVADWTATGEGERGPPLSERFDAEQAVEALRVAGFSIERVDDRCETFVVAATVPA